MSKIERFEELLRITETYADLFDDLSDVDNRRALKNTIALLKTYEAFGIDFGRVNHYEHENFKVGEFGRVEKWNERCRISWSDDDRQPEEGEYLYILSFPTGPYIFGQHYPEQLFRQFFKELVEYEPKYLDTRNGTLYFSTENAKYIHKDFPAILKKYKDRVKEDIKRIRKEQLEKELKELEEGQ